MDDKRIIPASGIPKSKRDLETRLESKSPSIKFMQECIVAGVAAGSKNVYDQLTKESTQHLIDLERNITANVLAELERRSLRGRARLRWLVVREWMRGYAIEMGIIDPLSRRSTLKLEPPTPTEPAPAPDLNQEIADALPQTD